MMMMTLKVKRDSSTDIGMHVLHTKMHINKHVIYSGVMERGNCVIMPTGRECVCCCEVESVVEKKEENHTDISCITDHEGFTPVCLDVWVLQTAYSNYRYHYGDPEEKHIHEYKVLLNYKPCI